MHSVKQMVSMLRGKLNVTQEASSLATSCGPSIFPYIPPSNANAVLKFLVDHHSEIFSDM